MISMNNRTKHFKPPSLKFLILFMLVISIISIYSTSVFAIQPTQQYNKIYLQPFYRESLTLNTNYTYNVTVNPPDGLSKVNSAILSFNAQINGQTQNFSLLVNGKSCNNPSFYIATAFSTTGNTQFYFDCSNIINQSGTYIITLRSSVNTGVINSWLDLTYMNNPLGDVLLHGTEYIPNEQGKMFLQFLDSSKQPISTSACLINIWYPNNTKLVNNSAMTYLDEGIFFYNVIIPSSIGVYPASAKCYYPAQFANYTMLNQVYDNFESGNFTGGSGWDNSTLNNSINGWDYYSAQIFTNATAGTGGCYEGNYCSAISGATVSTQYLERGFITPSNVERMIITFYLKSTMGNNDIMEYDIFDGTWHTIDKYYGTNFTAGVWYKKQYNLTVSEGYYFDSTAILQGFFGNSFTASNKYLYVDNFTISYVLYNTTISNVSAYQILMGSGEMHVSNLYNSLNTTTGNIAQEVWNYTNRNLTYYQNFTIPQQDLTNYTRIQDNQYNYTNRFDFIDTTLVNLNNTMINQFTQLLNNITQYYNNIINYIISIPYNVWNYTNRSLTYYQNFTIQQDLTNYTLINEGVWTYINRNLTYYPQYDTVNYTRIDEGVWNYTGRYTHGVVLT